MESTLIVTIFGVLLILAACNRAPSSLDEIINRNTDATGGRAAIEAIHSIRSVVFRKALKAFTSDA